MITIQTLHNDIVGLLYDIKELLTTYHGNLIALCVGIAVAVFNYNRPNAGMLFPFFCLKKKGLLGNFISQQLIFKKTLQKKKKKKKQQ